MKPRVLIVDDEPLMRRSLSETIRRKGYETIMACDGEDALLQLERSFASLIFADIRMPRMDGLELLQRIKAIEPSPQLVLITAYGSVEAAVQAMRDGAYDFLMKPFSARRIEEILERVLSNAPAWSGERPDSAIVSRDPKILELLAILKRVAPSSASVLIRGESGTGKELLARQVHLWSGRREKPFVAVNCAAIPESLLESELFGHERGAFTGAIARRVGMFEAASGGTLLLDEVSEMSAQLQAKLLRALQERTIDRVGGSRPIQVDVRIVATTNRDLKEEIRLGRFRQDLYFRLAVVPLSLPPLRERKGDTGLLARHFIARFVDAAVSAVKEISPAAIKRLEEWPWPGNVRELENCIYRSLLLCTRARLEPSDLLLDASVELLSDCRVQAESNGLLQEAEKKLILETLAKVDGNRIRAAEILGVSVRTIRNKLRIYRTEGKILPSACPDLAGPPSRMSVSARKM